MYRSFTANSMQVTMADEAAAQRACKDPNPIIDGRKANVNLAYLGAKPRLPVGDILCRCLLLFNSTPEKRRRLQETVGELNVKL